MLKEYIFILLCLLIVVLFLYRAYFFFLYETFLKYGDNYKKESFFEFTSQYWNFKYFIPFPISKFSKEKVSKRLVLKINISTLIIYFCIILLPYVL